MKWMMFAVGFLLYSVLATVISGRLMLSQTSNSYGAAVAFIVAPVIGFVFGLVGMTSGYYVYKKEYVGAAAITILSLFLVPLVFFSIVQAL